MKATICDIIHLTNVGRATRTPTKSSPPAYDTKGTESTHSLFGRIPSQPQRHFHPQLHRIATQNPHKTKKQTIIIMNSV